MKIYDCKTKGLMKLKENMWLTTEECIIRNCIIPTSVLILGSPAVNNVEFKSYYEGFTKIDHGVLTDDDIKQGLYLMPHNYWFSRNNDRSELLYLSDNNQTASINNLPGVYANINKNYISNKTNCIEDVAIGKGVINENILDILIYYRNNFKTITDHRKYWDNNFMTQSFMFTDPKTNNTDKYIRIPYVDGLYSVVNSNDIHELKWLTTDHIEPLNKRSKYGLVWLNDDNEECNIDDKTINTLKAYGVVMHAVHEALFNNLDCSIEDKAMSDLKNMNMECDREDISGMLHTIQLNSGFVTNNFKAYTGELNVNYEDYDTKPTYYNVYFDKCKSVFGLDAEPFNIEMDDNFCGQELYVRYNLSNRF